MPKLKVTAVGNSMGILLPNDSYIVHYAPVCARSRYDPGFAIRVNYFLWGA
uniref:Uncharacterized protein n=1 Tax=Candidatus Kentrum sp. FM TaxID=2126340 RepID=A0A450SPU3_9GAMM|nr:MAG: hypothetical protein BECKFM1743C_GA0114222_101676 [Candidatus Kentron sp. FM]VFJ59238.1 MAG: hypothetical protein BECKFM1743A_GA0114220_102331 [Candidatus Kentron sp. FM]VFK11209.1 MAG: hypothetical protein BECKFM1743B_GA0114221_101721 [Candidatus Kentron sp. FM]